MVQNVIKEFLGGEEQSFSSEKSFEKGKGWLFDLKIANEYFLSSDDNLTFPT